MRMKEPVVTRKALLRSVKELPEQVPVDELIDRILLLSKIERGLAQSAKGEVVSTAEARKRLRKWSK
jgi:predicted transcriptional regulator